MTRGPECAVSSTGNNVRIIEEVRQRVADLVPRRIDTDFMAATERPERDRRSGRGEELAMIMIRFDNLEAKRRALGFLAGRFSFKSWASGEMAVPEAALAPLAAEGIHFTVEGPANDERLISAARDPAAPAV